MTSTRTWRVLDILKWSEEYLTSKGVDNAKTVVEWLLCDVLSCSRIDLYLQFDRPMTDEERARFKPLLLKCAAKQPVQQVVGSCEFYGLKLTVSDKVLVPRPETERLVETAVDLAPELIKAKDEREKRSALKNQKERTANSEKSGEGEEKESVSPATDIRILDIGSGSGCIAVALAMHIPQSRLFAVESSADAVKILQRNIRFYNLENRVSILYEDIRRYRPERPFDMIVSNPPYISGEEMKNLDKNVSHYEPYMALSDSGDGLAYYRFFAEHFRDWLEDGGIALLEYGGNAQTAPLRKIFSSFEQKIVKDYQQDDRVMVLRKEEEEKFRV
ncbi:MAG: peptide chain release factor N(5)-glutamine methyltransferase [Candidatus Marinimicrobia bacterium]|nr:peptide chain release factor N(5)-glutamine methyltransferase [Candidatus Neomarinimicrobiota bacterium]